MGTPHVIYKDREPPGQKDVVCAASPLRVCAYLRKALSFINFAAREINCKIVYYGAGLGGKTTNLQVIYQKTADQQKGKMILAGHRDRTYAVLRFPASRPR